MIKGTRMMMKGGAPTPSVPTARDYVQDGLVAMWDGIENAGWGVHSDSPTDFKELVSGGTAGVGYEYGWSTNIPETPLYTIERDGVRSNDSVLNRSVGIGLPTSLSWYWNDFTIEFVRHVYARSTGRGYLTQIVGTYPTANTGIGRESGNMDVRMYYAGQVNTGLSEPFYGSSVTYTGSSVSGRTCIVHGVGTYTTGSGQFGPGSNTHFCFNSSWLDTTLNNVRIYNRALTAEEIAANYAIDKARFNLP